MGKRPKKNGGPSHSKKTGQGSTDDEDANGPTFFYMPKEKYGEFCQWYPSKFTVTKDEIARLVGRRDLYSPDSASPASPDSSDPQPSHPLHPSNPPITGSNEGEDSKGKSKAPATDDEDDAKNNGVKPKAAGGEFDGWRPITFNCAEQFMMYCKAARFGDLVTKRKILLSDDPKQQKRLGKLITGFDDASWDEVKYHVVVAGNMAKFGQSKVLRRVLVDTMCANTGYDGDGKDPRWRGRELVEAASGDPIWGIGFTAANAPKTSREKWGQNLLGKALMEVRERMMESTLKGTHQKYLWNKSRESNRAERAIQHHIMMTS